MFYSAFIQSLCFHVWCLLSALFKFLDASCFCEPLLLTLHISCVVCCDAHDIVLQCTLYLTIVFDFTGKAKDGRCC